MPRKSTDAGGTLDLFDRRSDAQTGRFEFAAGAVLLKGFALPVHKGDVDKEDGESGEGGRGDNDAALDNSTALIDAVQAIIARAPFRHMITPGGYRMSMAITNCGAVGWVSSRNGYRYAPLDPDSGAPWPLLPQIFIELAQRAAHAAGFEFTPDTCLLNCYEPGARLSLHQDKNERDFTAPIVSVSLGLPAIFLFGGSQRKQRVQRLPLRHGDVVVWGGPSRLAYHGVAPLAAAESIGSNRHSLLSGRRINLTFRKAL